MSDIKRRVNVKVYATQLTFYLKDIDPDEFLAKHILLSRELNIDKVDTEMRLRNYNCYDIASDLSTIYFLCSHGINERVIMKIEDKFYSYSGAFYSHRGLKTDKHGNLSGTLIMYQYSSLEEDEPTNLHRIML